MLKENFQERADQLVADAAHLCGEQTPGLGLKRKGSGEEKAGRTARRETPSAGAVCEQWHCGGWVLFAAFSAAGSEDS